MQTSSRGPKFTLENSVPKIDEGCFDLEFLKKQCSYLQENYRCKEGLVLYFPRLAKGFKLLTGVTYNVANCKDPISLRYECAQNPYWSVINNMRAHTMPPHGKTSMREAVVTIVRKVVQQDNLMETYLKIQKQRQHDVDSPPDCCRNGCCCTEIKLLQLVKLAVTRASSYMIENGLFCDKKKQSLTTQCKIILARLGSFAIFEE